MNLCSIEDVQLYKLQTFGDNPSGDDEAGRIEYLISASSDNIESICNRKFNLDSYDEVYNIDGSNLNLNQFPIDSITNISYGSPFGDEDRIDLETNQYTIDSISGILSMSLRFNKIEQYIRVQYDAGYETIPNDLNLICVQDVVDQLSNSTTNGTLKVEKLGDRSHTYFSSAEKQDNLISKLQKYIKCV